MKEPSISLIRNLSECGGVSGYEDDVASIVRSQLPDSVAVEKDNGGNLVAVIPGKDPNPLTILFAAHMDEVGFIVSDILPEGFLKVSMIGRWNTLTLPSSPVDIVNSRGEKVRGVFGQISPHFLKAGTVPSVPDIDDLFIDIGAMNDQSVRDDFNIEIGNIAVAFTPFVYSPFNEIIMGKAFDDRLGVATLIELAHKIASYPIGATVKFAFTVQEEVGVRGASILSNYIKADIAFIVEGAPADDMPRGPKRPQTCVSKGAHVRIFDPTHIGNPEILSYVDSVARDYDIPIQKSVRKGGGTDAMKIALSNRGVKSIVVGVPVRYAHSHCGVSSLSDYRNLIELLYVVCENSRKITVG
ncbi:MAG: M42 family metallopeptidase [Sphaerochaetaceae bacterium]|nr:M42 family metallopeptidase [Sphaerochaetaceae bacterium]MDC7247185.1 M42 family metallopeptidase [Sphaerochaetaceae bacterium]